MAHTTNRFSRYFFEALGLGLFMFSAGFFDMLIDNPNLYLRHQLHSDLLRRFLIGLTMGLTAFFIFTSKFGKESGAYINPSVTLVRYYLHDISFRESIFYIIFQFAGGAFGLYLVYFIFPDWIRDPSVNYIVTKPKDGDVFIAFIFEFAISFFLIVVVLFMEDSKRWSSYTPYVVSILIVLYITFEAPYSGMSMNPARTFASAVVSNQWSNFWLYCLAPSLGMLTGGVIYKFKHLKLNQLS